MSEEHIVPGSTPGQTDMARVNGGSDKHVSEAHVPLSQGKTTIHLVAGDDVDFEHLTPVRLCDLETTRREKLIADLTRQLTTAPLNLVPILTLLLAACGRPVEDAALTQPPASDSTSSAPRTVPEFIPVRGDGGAQGLHASTVGAPSRLPPQELSPEAKENILRRCLQAITDNELQPSAIHELCGLIDLDTVDRSHDVLWRWAPPIRSAPDPLTREAPDPSTQVCHLREAQDLLFWMFRSLPEPATGYAGRVITPAETAEPEIIDASLVAAIPQAAAATGGGGFGGGFAALPLLALGGGGTPAVAVVANPAAPLSASEGQIAAPQPAPPQSDSQPPVQGTPPQVPGTPPPPQSDSQPGTQITLLVVGAAPVAGAKIYIDENHNGVLEADERTSAKLKGTTDAGGKVILTIDQAAARYIADVSHLDGLAGMAWGIYYGQFSDAPPVHIISPLTNLLALNTANRRAEWRADLSLD